MPHRSIHRYRRVSEVTGVVVARSRAGRDPDPIPVVFVAPETGTVDFTAPLF